MASLAAALAPPPVRIGYVTDVEGNLDYFRRYVRASGVLRFDDHEWHPSADYMFFRNYMPDRGRLRQKLRTITASVMYSLSGAYLARPQRARRRTSVGVGRIRGRGVGRWRRRRSRSAGGTCR